MCQLVPPDGPRSSGSCRSPTSKATQTSLHAFHLAFATLGHSLGESGAPNNLGGRAGADAGRNLLRGGGIRAGGGDEDGFAVVAEFVDGVFDVSQRAVSAALGRGLEIGA